MSTSQFLGLVAAILWTGGVAAPLDKEGIAILSLFAAGCCVAISIMEATWL
jgi:hypothetical protein